MAQPQPAGGLYLRHKRNISTVWSPLHYRPERERSLDTGPFSYISAVSPVTNGPYFHANSPKQKCNQQSMLLRRPVQILLTPLGRAQCEGNFIPCFISSFYSHHSRIVGTRYCVMGRRNKFNILTIIFCFSVPAHRLKTSLYKQDQRADEDLR